MDEQDRTALDDAISGLVDAARSIHPELTDPTRRRRVSMAAPDAVGSVTRRLWKWLHGPGERRVPSRTSTADGFRHDRETDKTSPRALIRAPYLPGRLVDAEVLGDPMHVQEAQDKDHDGHQPDERKYHQGEQGHAVERGGCR